MQTKMFVHYMNCNNLKAKCGDIGKKPHQILEPTWNKNVNSYDSGLYVMRHMETYLSQDLKNWDSGFKRNSVSGIINLRIKYLHAILSMKDNQMFKPLQARAPKFIAEFRAASDSQAVTTDEVLQHSP